eukprot:352473-Chlamydomonas_euryale.AAC.4
MSNNIDESHVQCPEGRSCIVVMHLLPCRLDPGSRGPAAPLPTCQTQFKSPHPLTYWTVQASEVALQRTAPWCSRPRPSCTFSHPCPMQVSGSSKACACMHASIYATATQQHIQQAINSA